jgi:hypothetical protein
VVDAPFIGKAREGIFHYVSQRHGGNLHYLGIMEVSSRSRDRHDPRVHSSSLVDVACGVPFGTNDEPHPWICFDFRNVKVQPHFSSLMSFHDVPGRWRSLSPKSWRVGQADATGPWQIIDCQLDSDHLNDPDRHDTFAILVSTAIQFMRIVGTGLNHRFGQALELSALEFFRRLVEPAST